MGSVTETGTALGKGKIQRKTVRQAAPEVAEPIVEGTVFLGHDIGQSVSFYDVHLFLMRKLRQQFFLKEGNHVRIELHHRHRFHIFLFRGHEGVVAKTKAIGDDLSLRLFQRLLHGFDFT